MKWFRKKTKKTLPTNPIVYPHGTCVKTERGYFLVKDGKRYYLPTQRILESWSFPRVVETTEAAVANYRTVARIGFRDGSLICDIGSGKIYLISNNERRLIDSPEALELIGASISDATVVSSYEAELQRLGADLS